MSSSCTDSNTPVRMSEVDGITAIAAGAHGLALNDEGTVWLGVLTSVVSWAMVPKP